MKIKKMLNRPDIINDISTRIKISLVLSKNDKKKKNGKEVAEERESTIDGRERWRDGETARQGGQSNHNINEFN